VTACEVFKGNPADHTLVAKVIERHKKVAADRSFGPAQNDQFFEGGEGTISLLKLQCGMRLTGGRIPLVILFPMGHEVFQRPLFRKPTQIDLCELTLIIW